MYRAASIRVAEAANAVENAQRDINNAFMNEVAQILARGKVSVWDVLDAARTKWNFLPFEHLSENSFGSLIPARGYFHLKSLGDLGLAFAVLPLALPLLAGIALAIKFDSSGPILFRQLRVGRGGQPF